MGTYIESGTSILYFFLIVAAIFFIIFDIRLIGAAILPFLVMLGGVVLFGLAAATLGLGLEGIGEVSVSILTVLGIIFVTMLLMFFCLKIVPTEHFVGSNFLDELAKTEAAVCKMVKTSHNYIQAGVGLAGIDDPCLVQIADNKVINRASADGPLLFCKDLSDNQSGICAGALNPLAYARDISNQTVVQRLDILERTVNQFVEPTIRDAAVKAKIIKEPFIGNFLQARLDAINKKLALIKGLYLDPMQKKQDELRKGEASDAEKQEGTEQELPISP